MSLAEPVRSYTRTHPRHVTGIISVLGYTLVIGAFAGLVPVPEIGAATVQLFSDLIAVINTMALLLLVAGWRFIERGEIRKHRAAMLTSFALIMLFLVLYVWKVGGGFEKAFVGPTPVQYVYWTLLVIHILLSVVAVPVVLHAVVLGLSYSPTELGATVHPRVGRIAVAAWTLSLFLGIVTYVMLNHVYSWEPIRRAAPLFLVSTRGVPVLRSTD
jgi:putative membrane protein